MAEQKIELRKVRDFSENINDTFIFIKQQFKPLVTSFIGIAGIFMLASAVFGGLYQSQMGNIFKEVFKGGRQDADSVQLFGATYFIYIILTILNVVAMQVTVISFMKVYAAKQQSPTLEEVWIEFKKYYLKVFIYSIPIFLMIGFGFLLCVAPGVYWGVVLMPFMCILIMEDETFGGAYSRCFTLIKENFWTSFGIYIIMYLVYLVATMIISSIMALISGLLSYLTTNDIATTIGVATSVLNIVSYLFYIVFFVSVVLNYFSLTEKYDGTGMMERLEKLGQSGSDHGNIQEQY